MTETILKEEWDKAKDKVQHRWTKLSGEQVDAMDGDRDQLIKRVQETYDIDRTEAEMQVADFERTLQVG